MMTARALGGLLALLAAALVLGCADSGPKRHRVSGTVQYKGQPVKAGTVTFIPEGAPSAAGGAPIAEGKYDIPAGAGLIPGKYKVSVSYPDPKTVAAQGEMPGMSVQPREMLPAKYNASTELQAEVKSGASNEFSFDLK
jgi:hypothetical protein